MRSVRYTSMDTDVSQSLRESIQKFNTEWEGYSHKARYEFFEATLKGYLQEKPKPRGLSDLEILAKLFTEVTQAYKVKGGERHPVWGPHKFNYHFILGRKKEVADLLWHLCDDLGMKPSTVNVVFRIARDLREVQHRTLQDALLRTIRSFRKQANVEEDGLHRIWSEGVEEAVRADLGLPVRPPKGERKRRASRLGKAPGRVEPSPSPIDPPKVEAPPDPLEPPPSSASPREEELLKQLRELFGEYLTERLRTVPDEDKITVERDCRAAFRAAIVYTQGTFGRLSKLTRARQRQLYNQACETFGMAPPPRGLCDWGLLRRRYQGLMLSTHPDLNGGKANPQLQTITEQYKIAQEYHRLYGGAK